MKDLTNIPERFHLLFLNEEWKLGAESKLSSTEKIYYSQLFLEYHRWSIREKIEKNKTFVPILTEEHIEKEKL